MITFAHVNIVTDNWRKLADFYIAVFNCVPLYPERDLKGDWLDKLTGITNAHLTGIHLALPGYNNNLPTVEIFQYDKNEANLPAVTNRKGFGHIAFKVDNVQEIVDKLLLHGGTTLGQLVETTVKEAGKLTVVYAKDIDGNIIEIQHWEI